MSDGGLRVILDYDGTLTAEEEQVGELAERSVTALADDILKVPRAQVEEDYVETRRSLLAAPHQFCWEVNGLCASYCDEGAFILNTTTTQTMLRQNPSYGSSVAVFFRDGVEYDPIVDCTNYLFHRYTFDLVPRFRDAAPQLLRWLLGHPRFQLVILTSSRGDKVAKNLRSLDVGEIRILGDTRQYEMDPRWDVRSELGLESRFVSVDELRTIDLRRPAYYDALKREGADGDMVIVADSVSMPGALPLAMGHRFILVKTCYTPGWCEAFVRSFPHGTVIEHLEELPAQLETERER